MTVTILENNPDSIQDLDFEFEPPCESILGCDKVAEWLVTFKCCGERVLLCNPCMEISYAILKNCVSFRCQFCNAGSLSLISILEWRRL